MDTRKIADLEGVDEGVVGRVLINPLNRLPPDRVTLEVDEGVVGRVLINSRNPYPPLPRIGPSNLGDSAAVQL